MSGIAPSTWKRLHFVSNHRLSLYKDSNKYYLWGPGLNKHVKKFCDTLKSVGRCSAVQSYYEPAIDQESIDYLFFTSHEDVVNLISYLGRKRSINSPESAWDNLWDYREKKRFMNDAESESESDDE